MSSPYNRNLSRISEIIKGLTEEELRVANRLIGERQRFFWQKRNVKALERFFLNDRVYFDHKGQRICGTIVKINQRTVSIDTDDGVDWKVSPTLLRRT